MLGSNARIGTLFTGRRASARGSLPTSRAGTVSSGYLRDRFPINEVVETDPFVDRRAAAAAMKVAGVLPWLLLLARGIDRRAARAGEMDDQLEIVAHALMMP